jgi:Toprim-like
MLLIPQLEGVIKTVKSTNKELLLSFDNDPKGIEMSKEVEKMCKNIGVTPKLIQPSIGKDWNEESMKERVMEKEKNRRRVGLGMGF